MHVDQKALRKAISGDKKELVFAFIWHQSKQGHMFWNRQYFGDDPIDVAALKELLPEKGTLKELMVEPGDVVEWPDAGKYTILEGGRVLHESGECYLQDGMDYDGDGFRIVSRADKKKGDEMDTPKKIKDMTGEEVAELVMAWKHNKTIQTQYPSNPNKWYDNYDPSWSSECAYRIRPEPPAPVRETVCRYGSSQDGWWLTGKQASRDTHRITFTLEDGEPDLEKCPTCGTARHVDMETIT